MGVEFNSKTVNFFVMSKSKDEKNVPDSRPRERRYFSETFRKDRVREIEQDKASVSEIARLYAVSATAIYKWLRKYSSRYQPSVVTVVEPESETRKRIALEKQVSHLEQLLGQKEVELIYLRKLMDLAEARYGIDWKKNSNTLPLNGLTDTHRKES